MNCFLFNFYNQKTYELQELDLQYLSKNDLRYFFFFFEYSGKNDFYIIHVIETLLGFNKATSKFKKHVEPILRSSLLFSYIINDFNDQLCRINYPEK